MQDITVEIDKIPSDEWNYSISQFEDASLFQAWAAGAVPDKYISHIVIRRAGEIIGCCQVYHRSIPIFNIGIADIKWGPLCIKKAGQLNSEVLIHLIRSIKNEYGTKQRYLIRIWPHATGEKKILLKKIMENEGFVRNYNVRPYRSLRIDLADSIDDLRENLSRGWRRSLVSAEKSDLKVVEGSNPKFCGILAQLARNCARVKGYTDNMDYEWYRCIQERLPDFLKMRFLIIESYGEPICAAAFSSIGNTGVYTLTGTGEKAYKFNATHLLQWQIILKLKESGIRYYDLGPFNPRLNPGVYKFKQGIAGKKGWEEVFLGEYRGCFNLSAWMVKFVVDNAHIRKILSKCKAFRF